MSSVRRKPAKAYLYELQEEIKRSPTRKHALARVAGRNGISANALRMAAERAGLTSPANSLKLAFSQQEEEALVLTCLLYARQYTPLSIQSFIDLASIYAKKEKDQYFSYHFVYDFVERHSDELRLSEGKVTSATRCFEAMHQTQKTS